MAESPIEPTRTWIFDDAIRSRVDDVFAAYNEKTPGAAVGIYREGEIVYTHGYGMSNLEHGIPIAPDSIFHIASISKQFTDTCIALLESEGALDIDDDIRLYVPEVPDFGHTITIRHLIHHVSGLRDQWSLLELSGWRQDDLVTEGDVMDLLQRQTELNFVPNDEYLYCNTGYTLLAIVVKRVSGRTLRQFAQERIFGPLGMTRTHFHDDHSEIVPGRTQAYLPRKGGGYHVSIPVFDVVGTTSLFTTVEDLAKWDGNFVTAKVGGPELIARIQTPGTFNDGSSMSYAWGLVRSSYRGTDQVGHGGADHGYRADYTRLPEFGFTVTVLANVADANPNLLAQKVTDAVLGEFLAPASTAVATSTGKREKIPAIVTPSALAGTYFDAAHDAYVRITSWDGKPWIQFGEEPQELTTAGNGRFILPGAWNFVVTVADDSNPPATITASIGGEPADTFVRIPPYRPSTDELAAYAGTYWSEELAVSWEIAVDAAAGTLIVRRRKLDDETYVPLQEEVFGRGSTKYGTIVKFTRGEDGAVSGFSLTAGRIRNLRFVRR
jgi:CubicO group peptidase (beta-lactamase class C family)